MSKRYVYFKFKNFSFINHYGFSLIEIVVAMGILGVVMGLFSTSVVQLKRSQVDFENKADAMMYFNSLSTNLLGNQDNCRNMLEGTVLTPSKSNLTLRNISDFEDRNTLRAGDVISGPEDASKVRIRTLTINAKANVPDTKVTINDVQYTRKIAEIEIVTEQQAGGNTTSSDNYTASPVRKIELPVYVDPSNVIRFCQVKMNRSDVCNAIGSTLDPANNSTCTPGAQCFFEGTYTTSTCSPAYSGCNPGIRNRVTNAFSCPDGITATRTGQYQVTFTISCGKKCTQNIRNTITFYMCIRCDE